LGDPLALLIVTARPSALNKPRANATMKGAAPASIGRSRENRTAIGCRASSAARLGPAPKQTTAIRPVSEARKQRIAMVLVTRIGMNIDAGP
jgi:hypothetical protein